MRKKFLNALLWCGLIVGTTLLSLSSCKDYDEDIDYLQDQLASLTSTVEDQASEVESNVASLESTATSLSAQIEEVQDELQTAIDEKASSDDVETLEYELAALESSLSSVESAIEALESALDDYATAEELTEQVEALSTGIAEAKADAAAAQSTADAAAAAAQAAADAAATNAAAIEDIYSQISTISTNLETQLAELRESILAEIAEIYATKTEVTEEIQEAYDELVALLEALQESIDETLDSAYVTKADLESEITTVNSLISSSNSEIETLKSQVEELENSLSNYATKEELDAEIATLESRIDALEDRIEELEAYKETLDALDDTLDKLLGESKDYADAAAADAEENAKSYADSLYDELYAYYQALYTTLTTEYDTSESIEALNTSITNLSSEVSAFEDEVNGKLSAISDSITDLRASIDDINGKIKDIYGILSTVLLKSIVFSPTLYYQGIEAIGVNTYTYYPITLVAADLTVDQTSEEGTVSSTAVSIAPAAVATYYLNPQNAKISTDVDYYKFIVNNATYTRSVSEDDLTITSVAEDEDTRGKINVTFTVSGDISEIAETGDSKVDVVALQYTDNLNGDSVITSDFAALKKYTFADFALYKNEDGVDNADAGSSIVSANHLATSASDAIDPVTNEVPYFTVAYNDSLDLDDYVNAHYGETDCTIFGDNNDVSGDLTDKNFHIYYELIGYVLTYTVTDDEGTETTTKTSYESTYGTLSGTYGNVFTPVGATAIGHSPLVRATLVDENGDESQIACVHYFIVVVTDGGETVYDAEDPDDKYYPACNTTEGYALETYVLTNAELAEILSEVGLTKLEFVENYELVTDSVYTIVNGTVSQAGIDTLDSYLGLEDPVMTLAFDTTYSDGVIYWTINYDYANIEIGANGSISWYVKFKQKEDLYDETIDRREIYVLLTWTPEVATATLTVTYDQDGELNKVQADWHASDSRDKGTEDLHLQVGNSTDTQQNSCEYSSLVIQKTFITDLTDVFQAELADQGFDAIASVAAAEYYFAATDDQYHNDEKVEVDGESGTIYIITVSDDGTEIIATSEDDETVSETIATIDVTTGTITIQDNDVLYDIINGISDDSDDPRNDLVNMLTLTVLVDIDVCDEVKDFITIEDNVIQVKVLTPLYLGDGSYVELTLNSGTDLYATITDIDLYDFNGYDPTEFYEKAEGNYTFYDFYEIESIGQDGDEIWTTYERESGTTLSCENDYFTVKYEGITVDENTSYTNGEIVGGFGTVYLTQGSNMSRANEFDIVLPIVMTYKWGDLHSTITIHVNPAP